MAVDTETKRSLFFGMATPGHHQSAAADAHSDALRRPPRLDPAGQDQDHLPPQGQVQDPPQEAMESGNIVMKHATTQYQPV